eukprot:CAMPEP_0197855430 /NCGR_PEP_ID=MMETSP1438-20131217/26634_1 /TAXON_ID=1461541 /ORGANISM="Pterosperma sp., Strain CCMP1384" /LENGTH=597 /DNA_ID=CAMNT_0043470537 /DNA_START=75 /DNA_END=1864 /DNA_ORIENTATION=+
MDDIVLAKKNRPRKGSDSVQDSPGGKSRKNSMVNSMAGSKEQQRKASLMGAMRKGSAGMIETPGGGSPQRRTVDQTIMTKLHNADNSYEYILSTDNLAINIAMGSGGFRGMEVSTPHSATLKLENEEDKNLQEDTAEPEERKVALSVYQPQFENEALSLGHVGPIRMDPNARNGEGEGSSTDPPSSSEEEEEGAEFTYASAVYQGRDANTNGAEDAGADAEVHMMPPMRLSSARLSTRLSGFLRQQQQQDGSRKGRRQTEGRTASARSPGAAGRKNHRLSAPDLYNDSDPPPRSEGGTPPGEGGEEGQERGTDSIAASIVPRARDLSIIELSDQIPAAMPQATSGNQNVVSDTAFIRRDSITSQLTRQEAEMLRTIMADSQTTANRPSGIHRISKTRYTHVLDAAMDDKRTILDSSSFVLPLADDSLGRKLIDALSLPELELQQALADLHTQKMKEEGDLLLGPPLDLPEGLPPGEAESEKIRTAFLPPIDQPNSGSQTARELSSARTSLLKETADMPAQHRSSGVDMTGPAHHRSSGSVTKQGIPSSAGGVSTGWPGSAGPSTAGPPGDRGSAPHEGGDSNKSAPQDPPTMPGEGG